MTTPGPHYDANATMAVPALYLKKFYNQFPAKGILSCREIISGLSGGLKSWFGGPMLKKGPMMTSSYSANRDYLPFDQV